MAAAELEDDAGLEPLFKKLRVVASAAKREEALQALMHQTLQAMTDLVAHIEDNDPKATADKLAAALGALKLPAPQVTVNPQVTLEATMPPMPAPVIHFMPASPEGDVAYTIRIKKAYGPDTVMTVERKVSSAPQVERAPAPKRLAS